MLILTFAHRQSLANQSSSTIPVIILPKDDPEAFVWVCEALHFKKCAVDGLSVPLIKNIAIICAKYDLQSALCPWSHVCVQWMQGDGKGHDIDLLWISYAFEDHTAFWKASRALMLHLTCDEFHTDLSGLTDFILPNAISCEFHQSVCSQILTSVKAFIDDERDLQCSYLRSKIECMMLPILDETCPQKATHIAHNEPCVCLSRAGYYFQELRRLSLWPSVSGQDSKSLFASFRQFNQFRNYYTDDERLWAVEGYGKCLQPKLTDVRGLLVQAIASTMETQRGICLECILKGKHYREDGNCSAQTKAMHKTNMEESAKNPCEQAISTMEEVD